VRIMGYFCPVCDQYLSYEFRIINGTKKRIAFCPDCRENIKGEKDGN
jgi:hypothetical protein